MMTTERRRLGARAPQRNRIFWLLPLLGLAATGATDARAATLGYCTATAQNQLAACRGELTDEYASASAICLNESNSTDRTLCNREAAAARTEKAELCEDQLEARIEVCGGVGEGRYDPAFDEARFLDDYRYPSITNPYMPLAIGNTWDYASQDETSRVEVSGDTKLIDDVTCLVIHDRVLVDGVLKEDTDDWFAVARSNGDIWYCGEEVKDYEVFEGDLPQKPELVKIDGSFKVDRDGSKPGIFVPAAPTKGKVFRQEYSLGNAEDIVEVVETQYVFGRSRVLDAFVPRALANHLCGPGCVVTRESTPIEPDNFALKYYARGIGVFLEVKPDTGEVNRLLDCNFDSRCATLPQP